MILHNLPCGLLSLHIGSEPMELLAELKLLTEVLDHLESNLMDVGVQVQLLLTTLLKMNIYLSYFFLLSMKLDTTC